MASDFPRRHALTRGFRLGAPRNLAIPPGGSGVMFLRSSSGVDPVNDLWVAEVAASGGISEERLVDARSLRDGVDHELPAAERAKRERVREIGEGITSFSANETGAHICFPLTGRLFVTDVSARETRRIGSDTDVAECRIAPTGEAVAYTAGGSVKVADLRTGQTQVLCAPETSEQSWGTAEFIAAEEMNRFDGMWWSPAGDRLLVTLTDESEVPVWWISDPANPATPPVQHRYPAAGTTNADVSLWLVDLAGDRVRVDCGDFEYLTRVSWSMHGDPIVQVQSRDQRTCRILSVNPTDGSTTCVRERSGDAVIELVPGAPRLTGHGLIEVVDDLEMDTRRLVLNGTPISEPGLQIGAVVSDDRLGCVVLASSDPTTTDLYFIDWDGKARRLTQPGGRVLGRASGNVCVTQRSDLNEPITMTTVTVADRVTQIRSYAERPSVTPRPRFLLAGPDRIRTAVLMPTEPHPGALPILMSPYGGPHAQRAIASAASYVTDQWLADQGFCVVVADGPGSPYRGPAWEARIQGDLAAGPLAGQIAALEAVIEDLGDRVDPGRVGIRGWSFGGYLSALAVLERPDLFHAAVAGAPVTEWALYDTHYTERYLGMPSQEPGAYERSSLLTRAHQLSRPLLIVHGLSDDNVVVAHTLRLSAALLAAGREHSVLPLSGVTHMTPQEVVAENLLLRAVSFLRDALA
ncbi:MAG: prolyl oligopeptidase family serine peptidase [Candidatus Nanopelagicales bacterium]|nr:prolyl oligopeptidase family serine peptidase [Candidatus Nanopelagicales bacterium]